MRSWMLAGMLLFAGCNREREPGACREYEPGKETPAIGGSTVSEAIVGASAQRAGVAFELDQQLRSTCRRFGVDLGVSLQDLANSATPCALTVDAIRRERAGATVGPYAPVACTFSSRARDRCLAQCGVKTADCDLACDALGRARAVCSTPTVQASGTSDRLRLALEASYALVLMMRARAALLPSPGLRGVLDHVNDLNSSSCITTMEQTQDEADRSVATSIASLDALVVAVEGP